MLSAVIHSAHGYPASTVGTITGTPAVRPSRSSRTKEGSSQYSNAYTGYGPNCLTHDFPRITTGMDYIFILPLTLNESRSRHLNTLMNKASRLTLWGLTKPRSQSLRDENVLYSHEFRYLAGFDGAFFGIVQLLKLIHLFGQGQKILRRQPGRMLQFRHDL